MWRTSYRPAIVAIGQVFELCSLSIYQSEIFFSRSSEQSVWAAVDLTLATRRLSRDIPGLEIRVCAVEIN